MRHLSPLVALALVTAAGCTTEAPADVAVADIGAPAWNTSCPKSGRPVLEDAYFEHEGTRVYFCNQGCATEGAQDPEAWIARVYGDEVPRLR